MTDHRTQLQNLLRELFQFDSADLDFGIYRILNQRRAEIEAFIQKGLLDTVAQELGLLQADAAQVKRAALEKKAEEVRGNYGDNAIDEHGNFALTEFAQLQLPLEYARLKSEAESASVSAETEAEIFNALYTFFSRYYDNGDFVTRRRYSRIEKYAVPYNGEEVLLHWANRDQYYVKTADTLTDYTFVISPYGGYRVRFKIVAANTEQNNIKGENRFFVPLAKNVSEYDDGKHELVLYFEYRPLTNAEKETFGKSSVQAKIIEANHERLLRAVTDTTLRGLLAATQPDQEVSLLVRHLLRWTRKSTSDYFIHKDLRGFLERELDFYLKNEVMRLDDLDTENATRAESYLTHLVVIKRIGRKIIEFLAQIEEFQKRLFEKPKFVLESQWCVTVDRVPKELYATIAANDVQWKEWEQLFWVEKPKGNGKKVNAFLSEHPYLTIDTALYDVAFKDAVLAELSVREGGLAAQIDGLLIHSENLQALNLLLPAYRESVNCIYIDPPYNTGSDGFVYKDSFQHSSWLSLMADRVRAARTLMSQKGIIFTSIDDNEVVNLVKLLNDMLASENHVATLPTVMNLKGNQDQFGFAGTHEYTEVFAKSIQNATIGQFPLDDEEIEEWDEDEYGLFKKGANLKSTGVNAPREKRPNLFFPIYVSSEGEIRLERQSKSDSEILPITDGKEMSWRWGKKRIQRERHNLFVAQEDSTVTIYKKQRPSLGDLPSRKPKSLFYRPEYSSGNGTAQIKELFKEKVYPNPKPVDLIMDLILIGASKDSLVLDFFGGSGTTAHATINLNRDDNGNRKYILVEQGAYFDTVLKPRIQKVIYAANWRDGKPIAGSQGTSHAFQYVRLESYEDTLDSLDLNRDAAPTPGLFAPEHDDYLLKYFLDNETRKLQLNVPAFATPFDYQIRVRRDGVEKHVNVDLVETANYLLGINVTARRAFEHQARTYRVIEGKAGKESVVVIWRNSPGLDLQKEAGDMPGLVKLTNTDRIYINGESHIPNAQPIEAVFLNAMRGAGM